MSDLNFDNHGISTPYLTLSGISTLGRLVDVIDGDSLSIVLPVFNNYYRYNVRVNGIDTCEMKSKSEENKRMALKARNTILDLVTEQTNQENLTKKQIQHLLDEKVTLVWVECLDFDKYGRLLANIYKKQDDKQSLSEYLLEHKLAYKYGGSTKLTETQQLDVIE